MTNLFFTSDEHYGHGTNTHTPFGPQKKRGILALCNRPFASLEEMKEAIIERHNKTVGPSYANLTVHVGDLFWMTMSLDEAFSILKRLNGRHSFHFGNHDELIQKYRKELTPYFDDIVGENNAGGAKIYKFGDIRITANHFAMRTWEKSHRGHWHVYGHSHGALKGLGRSFDIGVDCHDFKPWSVDEIAVEMEKRPPHHTIDNTGKTDTIDESQLHLSPGGQNVNTQ